MDGHGAGDYNDQYFNPAGPVQIEKDKKIIERFSLSELFDQYIKSTNTN